MRVNRDAMRYHLLKTAYQAVCAEKQKQFEAFQAVLTFALAYRQAGQGNQTEAQAEQILNLTDDRDAYLNAANEVETLLRNMMNEALAQSTVFKAISQQENKNAKV
jgi:hypothetical protein